MALDFFFDIDGTLLPIGQPLPKSALEAMNRARSLGHRLFLSTGRSIAELSKELDVFRFDGAVLSAGACVMFQNKYIQRKYASKEQLEAFFRVSEKYNLLWFFQGPDVTYAQQDALDFHNEMSLKYHGRITSFPAFRITETIPADAPMSKAYIMSREGNVLKARAELEGPFHSTNNTTGFPETVAAELMLSGISKSSGIKTMLDYLGDDISCSVGVGDGENDLDMIDFCHLGIAMGNSCEVLKQHADFVSTADTEDGIKNAIEYAIEHQS